MNLVYVIYILCQIPYLFTKPANCAIDVAKSEPDPTEAHPLPEQDDAIVEFAAAELSTHKWPTVLIVTLFRNKAHTMPYFFSYLDRLAYPKNRISLWFRSDHNTDNTLEVLHHWLFKSSYLYHNVDIEYENKTKLRESETSQTHWSPERYMDVIRMKEMGLNYARKIWADFVFFLDADVFLTKSTVLFDLVRANVPIIAPMLLSDGLYSNFWCGMTSDYYYQRTDQYKEIYSYEQRGLFNVPMVHSAVLINLNDKRSDTLTFNKTILSERFSLDTTEIERIPIDDIILFALSANFSQLPLTITNDELYGFVTVPLESDEDIAKDQRQLTNTKILILNDHGVDAVTVEPELERFVTYPVSDTMSLDRIFMINLIRRPERRAKMERSFKEVGLTVEYVAAIDGQKLTDEYLDEIGVRYLPGYADPFHNRPMTLGEIGCFLSHFWVWEKQVAQGLKEILVLEDDIRFEPFFKERALSLLDEAREIGGWDLIYFGRKRMVLRDEKWVQNSNQLTYASYSYWTLGYVLSLEGAKKLLAARPLENLIPVDEFLPVMFNQHLNATWKKAFPNRNLVAWSAAPLLVFPTHYTGENGYFSDTEESNLITDIIDEGNDGAEKKGNKEIFITEQRTEPREQTTSTDTTVAVNNNNNSNGSIDTSFIINSVNEHPAIQKSSDQHREL